MFGAMTEERRRAWAQRKQSRKSWGSGSSERRPTAKESHGGLSDAPLEAALPGLVTHGPGGTCPKGSSLTVAQIAYLYQYQGKGVSDIVASHYKEKLTHAQVHAALAYYYAERGAVDLEISTRVELCSANSLATMGSLPRASVLDLAGNDEFFSR